MYTDTMLVTAIMDIFETNMPYVVGVAIVFLCVGFILRLFMYGLELIVGRFWR